MSQRPDEDYEKLDDRVVRYLNGSKCLFILFDPLKELRIKQEIFVTAAYI